MTEEELDELEVEIREYDRGATMPLDQKEILELIALARRGLMEQKREDQLATMLDMEKEDAKTQVDKTVVSVLVGDNLTPSPIQGLVERLREWNCLDPNDREMFNEAADALERMEKDYARDLNEASEIIEGQTATIAALRAENERLDGALKAKVRRRDTELEDEIARLRAALEKAIILINIREGKDEDND